MADTYPAPVTCYAVQVENAARFHYVGDAIRTGVVSVESGRKIWGWAELCIIGLEHVRVPYEELMAALSAVALLVIDSVNFTAPKGTMDELTKCYDGGNHTLAYLKLHKADVASALLNRGYDIEAEGKNFEDEEDEDNLDPGCGS